MGEPAGCPNSAGERPAAGIADCNDLLGQMMAALPATNHLVARVCAQWSIQWRIRQRQIGAIRQSAAPVIGSLQKPMTILALPDGRVVLGFDHHDRAGWIEIFSSDWNPIAVLRTDGDGNDMFLRPYGLCHEASADVLYVVDCKTVQCVQLPDGLRLRQSVQLENPCTLARQLRRGTQLVVGQCLHSDYAAPDAAHDSILVLQSDNLQVQSTFGHSQLKDVTELVLLTDADQLLAAATSHDGSSCFFIYAEDEEGHWQLIRTFHSAVPVESVCCCRTFLYAIRSSQNDGVGSAVAVIEPQSGVVVQLLELTAAADLVDICATPSGSLLAVDYAEGCVHEFLFV